ncbi:MAG TPA: cellulose binding domain-containing protein [Micromonosporaceae bacterium]|nr:cellulose binding domain-containing protein [Micromonosporaceae bacterium]
MGRHSAPEEPPPPKDKPRYRFVVALAGILCLGLLAMAVVNAIFPEQSPQAVAGPDPALDGDPVLETPGEVLETPGEPSPTDTPGPTPPPPSATAGPNSPSRTSTTPAGPPPGDAPTGQVSGAYSLSGTPWPDGFIGSVQLTNNSDTPQPWQVVLVMPANVGELHNRWISGGPGSSSVTRSGQTIVFNSTEPLAAGSSIGLFFQFAKEGPVTDPEECWVNGRACS